MPLPPCVCGWRCRDQAAAHIGKALAVSSPREPSGSAGAGWAGHGDGSVPHAMLQGAVVLGSRQKVSTDDRSPGAGRDPLYKWAAPTPLCKWHGGAVEASGHVLRGVYLLGGLSVEKCLQTMWEYCLHLLLHFKASSL